MAVLNSPSPGGETLPVTYSRSASDRRKSMREIAEAILLAADVAGGNK
jgi:hypothetical protein